VEALLGSIGFIAVDIKAAEWKEERRIYLLNQTRQSSFFIVRRADPRLLPSGRRLLDILDGGGWIYGARTLLRGIFRDEKPHNVSFELFSI
jgi:hypothetical protein